MWLSEKRAFDEYVRLRPKRDAEERRWIENRHNSVMNQVSEWVSEKIAGFVVIVGGYASSIHRDLGEAKEIARANRDFHSDVRLKRIRVPDSKI
jgi:hypothetical protein